MSVNITVNKKVEVLWVDKIYKTIIQDINEEKEYLAILPPIKNGIILPLHKGDEFEAIYYDEKGIYQFRCIVLGRKYEAKVELLVISFPKNLKKVQRREFVRVNVVHSVKYVKISNSSKLKDGENILKDGNGKSGILMDISGGGVKLKTTENTSIGDIIVIELQLANSKFIILGEVVRDEKEDSGIKVYGISFVDMNERTRDKIIQLIFEIMRKQSKTV